jgi:hypothetical protein
VVTNSTFFLNLFVIIARTNTLCQLQGGKARDEWAKWFAFDKGVYQPNEKDWTPASRLLPQSNDEFPQVRHVTSRTTAPTFSLARIWTN